MPIYEYECEKCGVTFEAMQNISAKPLKTCNGLGCEDKDNGKVHRVVSASGFILKGSGWYTSDYPSEARKKGWEQEGKQSKGEAGASEVPTENTKTPTTEKIVKAAPTTERAKKTSQKNPYSSGKSKKAKGSK
jgi:putative FmdB family regulatory protein